MVMELKDFLHKVRSELSPVYGESETNWMIRTIFEHLKGWSHVDLVLHNDYEVSDFLIGKVEMIVKRLLKKEPIQYIFGDTYWYGMTLKVTPAVLIPRPETEELVDMIVKENNVSDLNVLDICTGSGCIAIALAKNLPFSNVDAIDISDEALSVARENAKDNKAKVNFYKKDALDLIPDGERYNIIVSNPPYIMNKERENMDANVLDYEPHIALFVPDNNPLEFYKSISEYAIKTLVPGGKLYLEINPLSAEALCDMLKGHGWTDVELIRDMYKNNRFVKAVK